MKCWVSHRSVPLFLPVAYHVTYVQYFGSANSTETHGCLAAVCRAEHISETCNARTISETRNAKTRQLTGCCPSSGSPLAYHKSMSRDVGVKYAGAHRRGDAHPVSGQETLGKREATVV